MAIIAQNTSLNVTPGGIIPTVHVSQYDENRLLTFTLMDGNTSASIPAGTTVKIDGTKPSKKGFEYSDASIVSISGNIVTVNTALQMTVENGTVECKIELTYNSQIIGTALFFMEVERAGLADDTDVSETVLPVYMEAGRQYMLGSEAWAVGTKNGEPVGSSEPQYNNYSKYYADRAHEDAVISGSAMLIAGQSAESAQESAVISGSAMRIAGQSAATAQSAAADALGYKSQASVSAAQAAASAIQSAASAATSADAEAWAVGERAGQPVDPDDPTFHNNAKFYAEQAEDAVEYGIVDMTGATATTNGAHGAAPQPVAGQQNHYLKGDGTWSRADMTVTEITDSAPYLYRASKGGDRQYDELVGGSVVWNQLISNGDFSDGTTGWGSSRGTLSVSDGVLTETCTTDGGVTIISPAFGNVQGHKIIVAFDVKVSTVSNDVRASINSGSIGVNSIWRRTMPTANTWEREVIVAYPTEEYATNLRIYQSMSVDDTISVKNVYLTDLTAMFGSTIADYIYAREIAETGSGIAWIKSYGFFSKDYYAYDTGSILSVNTSGHKLVGYTVNTYPLTPTDLRGILSLSGNELVYDGDIYESDGTETVKYALLSNQTGAIGDTITLTGYKTSGKIICDKGLISDIGTISGTTLTLTAAITSASFVYELDTPTTATLSPFVSPQICDKDGTEEYIDTRTVPMPVGHYTEYYGVPEWLRDRYLDELRELPYKITPISNGGTGLSSSPSMLTNLGSTSADDILKASPRPGVTGTLPIENGGTGATTRLNAVKALTNESVASPNYLIGMTNSWGKFGYVSPANAKTFLNIPFSLLDYLGVDVPSNTTAIDFWRTIVPVENRTVFVVTPGTAAGGVATPTSPWGATNTNRSSGANKIGAYSCKLATLTTSSSYGRGQCEKVSTEYRVYLMTGSESDYVLLAAYIVGNKIQNFKIYEMYNSSSNNYNVLIGMIF